MNSFDKILSLGTEIVVDSANIIDIEKYNTSDVTTNPSLILKAIDINNENNEEYLQCLDSIDLEHVLFKIGMMILPKIKGYLSIEINPSCSYDTNNIVKRARKIIKKFDDYNIDRKRILIKIAATWDGIKAAEILEKENIQCNMTLIFSLFQAVFCANVNATLISPFVGRVTDWYKTKGYEINNIKKDYGVNTLKNIACYFKENNINTIVMGASFRNIDQIKELAGIQKLTVSPSLIESLKNNNGESIELNHFCNLNTNCSNDLSCLNCGSFLKEDFDRNLSNNKLVSEKLDEGITTFIKDTNKFIEILIKMEKLKN